MDAEQIERDNQCAVCGESLGEKTEQSDELCLDCKDSWERELESAW